VQQFGFMDTEFCYAPPVAYVAVPGARRIVVGEVDGDGHADVVLPGATGGIAALLGDGSGALAAPVFTPVDAPTDAVSGDFDGDGQLDLVVSFAGAPPRLDIMLGDGAGGFVVEASFATGPTVGTSLITGDFDGDGDVDAAAIHQGVGNTTPKRLTALTNAGGGAWSSAEQPLNFFVADITLESWTPYLTAGNFDGAHLDLIVATDRSVETLHRLRSDGLGGFTYEGKLHASLFTGVMPIVTLDVDGDGDDDIIGAVKPGTPAVKFVKNLGGLTWGGQVQSDLTEDAKQQVALGDLIHEPRPDLVYSAVDGRTLARTIGVDGKVLSPGGLGFQIAAARSFALADLNEDGHSDLVFLTHAAPYTLSVTLSE